MSVELPLFPLGTVLFPGMILPLHIFEERYRTMMTRHADADPMFGVVLTKRGREVADQPEIHEVGTAASLLQAVQYADGRWDITVRGSRRFRVLDGHWDEGYLTGVVTWIDEGAVTPNDEIASLVSGVKAAFAAYLDALEQHTGARIERPDLDTDPLTVAYAICAAMPFALSQRQKLLEASSPATRLGDVLRRLRRERELLKATGIGSPLDHPGRTFSTN